MKKIATNHDKFMDVFIGISQAMRCWRQDTAFCEGVTFHQFIILDAVGKNKELNISDLHRILSVEKSTTTRLVNPLIQKGLIERKKSSLDSRAFVLTLTENGRNVCRNVQSCLEGFLNKVEGKLPAGRQDSILRDVRLFTSAIKNAAGVCDCCD